MGLVEDSRRIIRRSPSTSSSKQRSPAPRLSRDYSGSARWSASTRSRSSSVRPSTASRTSGKSASLSDLLVAHLERAERTLATQHEAAVNLLKQHLGLVDLAEDVNLRADFNTEIQSWNHQRPPNSPTGFLFPLEGSGASDDDRVPRPSSVGQPGKPVPHPTEAIPTLPSQPVESIEHSFISHVSETLSEASEQENWELLPIWQKRKQLKPKQAARGTRGTARPSFAGSFSRSFSRLMDEGEGDDELSHTNRPTNCWRHVILHPMSRKRGAWDISSLVLVMYDMVMIPFGLFDPPLTTFLVVMNHLTRYFWTGDLALSFASGYVDHDGTVEMRPRCICKRYARTWLFLDFLVVGVDWVEFILDAFDGVGMARMSKVGRAFRIIRMVRLLRIARMSETFSVMLERLPSDVMVVFGDIVKLVVSMLAAGHLIACLWFAVGKASPADRNWIRVKGYWEESLDYQYIMSMRWALSQFAGGMDEVVPESLIEHIYAACVFIMAFWLGTVFLSILTSHMTQLYIIGSKQTQQLTLLRKYLSTHGVSRGLAMRAQRNAQHLMQARNRTMPEEAVILMKLVSQALRIELHYEMYSPWLASHPFFADYMQHCPQVVRKICHGAVSMAANAKGDVIFTYGETASSMYIVRSGKLCYSWSSKRVVRNIEHVDQGMWVSEGALWVHWMHRGSLTVVEDSIIYEVNARAFQDIVGQFEQTSFDPSEYADGFVQFLNSTTADITDLYFPGTSANSVRVLDDDQPDETDAEYVPHKASRARRKSSFFIRGPDERRSNSKLSRVSAFSEGAQTRSSHRSNAKVAPISPASAPRDGTGGPIPLPHQGRSSRRSVDGTAVRLEEMEV